MVVGTYTLNMSCKTCFRVLITIAFSSIPVHVTGQQVDNEFTSENLVTYSNASEYSEVGFNHVEMLKKCDPSYMDDESVKQRCSHWPSEEDALSFDVFKNLPVTSIEKNITYWNTYCALCNFEFEFVHRVPISFNANEIPCKHKASDIGFQFPPGQNANWTGTNRSQICDLNTTVCTILKNSKYGCLQDDELITDGPDYTIPNTSSQFCTKDSSKFCTPVLEVTRDLLCRYGSNIRTSCTTNVFLYEGIDFTYGDNGSIFVYDSKRISRYYSYEYSNRTGMNRTIYLCGQEGISLDNFLTIILTLLAISMIFFALCVALNSNTESLRNLPNRTLYSYCLTSLIYLFSVMDVEYLFFTGSCFYMQIVLNATAMSAILWSCVVLLEYGLVTYCLMGNKRVTDGIQMQKYLIYCSICWILPVLLYGFMFSLTTIDGQSSSCPEIDNYSVVYCSYKLHSAPHWKFADTILEMTNVVISIFVTFGFCAMAFAMINLSRRDTVRSTHSRNYLIIFLKMLCATSSHFVFFLLAYLVEVAYGSQYAAFKILFTVYDTLDYSQGIFIYFAFYYKKSVFERFLRIFKLKKTGSPRGVEMAEKAPQNN